MPAADASYSGRWLSLAVVDVAQVIVLLDAMKGALIIRRRETRRSGEERPRFPCDHSSVPCDEGSPARRRPSPDGRAVAAISAHHFRRVSDA